VKNNPQVAPSTDSNSALLSSRKPIFCLVGGGFAVGKSTLAKRLKETDLPYALIIDPDLFILKIPEFAHWRATDPNDAVRRVYDEALDISNSVLATALARRLDVIWDIVADGPAIVDAMQWVKEIGYYVRIDFADCPIELAMERAIARSKDSSDPLHYGRDPRGPGFWLPPAFPEAEDLLRIKALYAEETARLATPINSPDEGRDAISDRESVASGTNVTPPSHATNPRVNWFTQLILLFAVMSAVAVIAKLANQGTRQTASMSTRSLTPHVIVSYTLNGMNHVGDSATFTARAEGRRVVIVPDAKQSCAVKPEGSRTEASTEEPFAPSFTEQNGRVTLAFLDDGSFGKYWELKQNQTLIMKKGRTESRESCFVTVRFE
jgi:predicted kinase